MSCFTPLPARKTPTKSSSHHHKLSFKMRWPGRCMKFQSYAPGLILTLTLGLDPFTSEEATATPVPSSFQMTLRALVSLWPYILFNDRRAKLSSNLGCLSTEMQASAGVHVNTHTHTGIHTHSHTSSKLHITKAKGHILPQGRGDTIHAREIRTTLNFGPKQLLS